MLETTGQRMQPPSDGNHRTRKSEERKSQDCKHWFAKANSSQGESSSFKHDVSKRGKKVKANVRRDHDHKAKTVKMDKVQQKEKSRKAPVHQVNRISCFSYLNGKCTKSSCDYWHPPDCVKHKTDERCKVGETCAVLHSDIEAPNKKSKRDQKSEKATVATVRGNQIFVLCITGRRSARTNVWATDVRRTILKKRGGISRTAHLELKFSKIAERFVNIREDWGPSL